MGSYSRRILCFKTPKFGLSIDIRNSDLLEIPLFSRAKNETANSNSSRCLADSICLFFINCTCENKILRAQSLWTRCHVQRRIERCSTRFRSGDRFLSQVSDTCHQTVREKNVGPINHIASLPLRTTLFFF